VDRSIEVLLFDWDGTLADSERLGRAAFDKCFAELGVSFSNEIYDRFYSPNWYSIYAALGLPRATWPRADELWRYHYGQQTAKLVKGAAETLLDLHGKGYRLGIVTSANEDRVSYEIDDAAMARIFEVVVCAEHIAHRKPHPEGLDIALRRLNCSPAQAAYIGDTPEDIEMGKRGGVLTIGVLSTYPNSVRVQSCDPDLYLNSITELKDHF
jgi:HAD superfamily hydrolase (TIGR01549 family)